MLKKILAVVFILLLAAAVALFFVPWNRVLEGRVIALLEAKGLHDTSLTIDSVNFHEAHLSHVTFGGATPLTLQSITLHYSPRELLGGALNDVTLTGVDLTLQQTDSGWSLSGLPQREAGTQTQPLALTSLVNSLPFTTLSIEDSTLRIAGKTINGAAPFTLSLTKGNETQLTLKTLPATIRAGNADIALGTLNASAKPTQGEDWSGQWSLDALDLSKLTPMPVLQGGGALSFEQAVLTLDGNLDSADKTYRAAFGLLIDPAHAQKNAMTLNAASFPFKEGRVSTKNVVIPLSGNQPVSIAMSIQQVSVDEMLQTLTGQKVAATGTFSGSVPLILKRDGTFTLGKGALQADGGGTIQMAGAAIPGDNAQVKLVRDILANLQYTVLSAGVESAGGNAITVRLSLEGKNPDVLDGRPVKLNINLSGDVLDFIRQNIMLITNPEKLLEQAQ